MKQFFTTNSRLTFINNLTCCTATLVNDRRDISTTLEGIIFSVCETADEKWNLAKEMIESRLQYSRMLKQLEDHLSAGQSMLNEIDNLSTGHTAGHARTLMHRAQVDSTQPTLCLI